MSTKNINRLKFWYKVSRYLVIISIIDIATVFIGKFIFDAEMGLISTALVIVFGLTFGKPFAVVLVTFFTLLFFPSLISYFILRRKIIKREKDAGVIDGLQKTEAYFSSSPKRQRIYKIIIWFFVIVVIGFIAYGIFEPSLKWGKSKNESSYTAVARQWTPRLVKLYCGDAVGSGTLFKHEGDDFIVLTNKHVVEDGVNAQGWNANQCWVNLFASKPYADENVVFYATLSQEKSSLWPEQKTSYISSNEDLALLRPVVFKDNYRFYTSHFTRRIGFIATSSKALYLASADELNICSSSAVIGEEIIILGFPRVGNQDGLTLSRGIISGIEGNHYVTDAKVEFGSSGGAAISVGRNCFIGIPSFIVQGEAETFARILDVSNLLDNN